MSFGGDFWHVYFGGVIFGTFILALFDPLPYFVLRIFVVVSQVRVGLVMIG